MESFHPASGRPRLAAIMSKPSKTELARILPDLVTWLKNHNYGVIIDRETSPYIKGLESITRAEMASRTLDLAIVLGGDGTLLSAARAVSRAEVPILGVNLGSLGFLTEVPLSQLYSALDSVEAGRSFMDSRSMIRCELTRTGSTVVSYESLNDVIVSKSSIARLNHFDLFIDQMFVSAYKADGLIIATPTGSTAYSLAAGGPILTPTVHAFVITPVSPHALTHRPLLVPDTAEIQVQVNTGQEEAYLSVDGQVGMPVHDGDRVLCRKSEHNVHLLRFEKSFFEVLRTKLKWGQR